MTKANQVIEATKRRTLRPSVGELYTICVPSCGWFYALLAKDNVYLDDSFGPFRIVYVYENCSKIREDVPDLHRDRLLIPISVCNSTPWTTGKFEYLNSLSNWSDLCYAKHSFFCDFFTPIRHFDESGTRIERPLDPCLRSGMSSGQSIDFEIGLKLGLLDEEGQLVKKSR